MAVISDCHLFANSNELLNASNPDANLTQILQKISEDEPYDYILLSGDIADKGEEAAYERLAFKIIPYQVATYYAPGNHDDLSKLQKYFKGDCIHHSNHFTSGNWQFILLNSARAGYAEGYLPENELAFLKNCLISNPSLFTIIVLHHHPIPSDSFMDNVMLVQPEFFLDIISQYKTVRAVLFGHIHQVIEEFWQGIAFLSTPSTAYQITPRTQDLIVDALTPGYRWLEFENNGNIKTSIIRLPMSEVNGKFLYS